VVPGLGAQRLLELLASPLQHGLTVRYEHPVEVELEQRLERRVEAVAVEAADVGVDPFP
jgi:hypothetical protein